MSEITATAVQTIEHLFGMKHKDLTGSRVAYSTQVDRAVIPPRTGRVAFVFANDQTDSGPPSSTPIVQEYLPSVALDVQVETLEGEVEKIDQDVALVVFRSESGEIERLIPRRRLTAEGADYEGARVRLIISEVGSRVSSQLEYMGENVKPIWASPDEMMIQTFRKLKANLKSKKR